MENEIRSSWQDYLLLTGSMKFVCNDVNCETIHVKKVLNR
jgi:hypothetical protein